jgi:hypothetical protein
MFATNVDISDLSLTMGQASDLLDHVEAGREPVVREVLITLGGRPEGPLPSPDEVQVRRKLGRIMLILPHGFDEWAAKDGKVIVDRVPEGLLIKVVDQASSTP